MSLSGEIILRFTEDAVNVTAVKKSGKKINILKTRDFELTEAIADSGALSYVEEGIDTFQNYIKEEKLKGKNVKVVISQDGIITRLIQSPKLKKRDLENFINNNIEEYFTLNIGEYNFDYTVVGEEKAEVDKFNILLVLFPKNKLGAITNFIKSHELEIETITVYPVCVENVFSADRDKSIAVFDVGEDRANITVLEKGTIFLYSRANSDIDETSGDYDEILDSLMYFLNFYSTRHFGNRVDKIYVTGKMWNNRDFHTALGELTPIGVVSGIKRPNIRIEAEEGIDKNLFVDVIGTLMPLKRKYNKEIDFVKYTKKEKRKNEKLPLIVLTAVLLLLSIAWPAVFMFYRNLELEKLDTTKLNKEKSQLAEQQQKYNELSKRKEILSNKEVLTEIISAMDIDFSPYIEALRKALPADTYFKSFHIDSMNADITFAVKGTINKVVLAESINNTGIFERIDIQSIALDDSETEAQFTLKIAKPLKGE